MTRRAIWRILTVALLGATTSGFVWSASPQTADGHPDLNGFWKGTRDTVPGGNIAKDLPGLKLPLTPAGEAAWKHNTTATIDPESLCILGGIPRHNASGLPFQIIQSSDYVAFLYFYTYYRLIPTDGRKHDEDPDPSYFGDEVGQGFLHGFASIVLFSAALGCFFLLDFILGLIIVERIKQ